jgi:hypothetical protein
VLGGACASSMRKHQVGTLIPHELIKNHSLGPDECPAALGASGLQNMHAQASCRDILFDGDFESRVWLLQPTSRSEHLNKQSRQRTSCLRHCASHSCFRVDCASDDDAGAALSQLTSKNVPSLVGSEAAKVCIYDSCGSAVRLL